MQLKSLYTISGETIKVSNHWDAETESRSTTISSSTWSYTGAGTLSGDTLATPLTTTKLAATGSGVLKNTVALANGEVLVGQRSIVVTS